MREFVGVSFASKDEEAPPPPISGKDNDNPPPTNSQTPEDSDVFYICTADSPHITTWTKKGVSKIPKWIRDPDKQEDPYQAQGILI
jgi:hypothetical protein